MKYGVREICDVVLRAKGRMKVGSKTFYKDEPVLYFDSLTTSSMEGAATTDYARGGRGNARLMAWEGERTLTWNMTDALISPESFSVLSGADIYDAAENTDRENGVVKMLVHTTTRAEVKRVTHAEDPAYAEGDYRIFVDLPGWNVAWNHTETDASNAANNRPDDSTPPIYSVGADIFLMQVDGDDMSAPAIPYDMGVYQITVNSDGKIVAAGTEGGTKVTRVECYDFREGSTVLVDYYNKQVKGKQIEITPDKFGGYFYLEGSTLFRNESTGEDDPAEFIIPRCKIQSNFTFTMASTGDPSTFDFVLDAFPDYTKFDNTKKVLAVVQVVQEDAVEDTEETERHHTEKKDNKRDANNTDHKTRYGEDVTYAESDDKVASSDFNLGTTVDVTANLPDDAIEADFGKSVSEIQTDVTVSNGVIEGTSKYVTDFTEFSGNPAEQQGNYLVLKADVEGADMVTVQVKRTMNEKAPVQLDADRTIILLLTPETTIKSIEVVGKKNGEVVGKKDYILDLTYQHA